MSKRQKHRKQNVKINEPEPTEKLTNIEKVARKLKAPSNMSAMNLGFILAKMFKSGVPTSAVECQRLFSIFLYSICKTHKTIDFSESAPLYNKDYSHKVPSKNKDQLKSIGVNVKPIVTKRKEEVIKSEPMNLSSKEFYESWEWRTLAYNIKKKYKATCMCCGKSPEHGIYLCVDHIKPISKYPELRLDPDNLQILCNECNQGKSNVDETDWRPKNP